MIMLLSEALLKNPYTNITLYQYM